MKFLSCVNDYMATCIALAKTYSAEYFCNTKVAGLGRIFVQQKIFGYIVVPLLNPMGHYFGCNMFIATSD